LNTPAEVVENTRLLPVPSLVTSTVADGITAPDGSFTVPVKDPKVLWPDAYGASSKRHNTTENMYTCCRDITSPHAHSHTNSRQRPVFENVPYGLLMRQEAPPGHAFARQVCATWRPTPVAASAYRSSVDLYSRCAVLFHT